jgi:RND family efflux transporter MFP subunit
MTIRTKRRRYYSRPRMAGGARTWPALVLFGLLVAGCAEPPPPPEVVRPVRAVRVGDATALSGRVLPGKAKATQEVNLSFRVSGPLISRPIDVGDEVTEGQVLAKIDPRDFEVNLRNVRAQLAEAKAAETLTTEELARAQDAFDRGAVSEIEMARQRARRDTAVANVQALEAAVDAAADALAYTELKATFDGTITAIYVENFELVQAKQAIARLLDDSRIEMVVDVPEQSISNVPYVQDIVCWFDTFPDLRLPAEIKEIGTEASQTTRTYPVTLIMDQPEPVKILPGMTGRATGRVVLPDDLGQAGVEIPATAVVSEAGQQGYVWVIDESSGVVRRQAVTVGETTARGIRVQGLEPGQWVATAGAHYLVEGQQVRILDGGAGGGPTS